MENQHRKIAGYRELSQVEIDLMNEIKEEGKRLGVLVDRLRNTTYSVGPGAPDDKADGRWVSIGATHMQEGLMALTRSIAKPEFF